MLIFAPEFCRIRSAPEVCHDREEAAEIAHELLRIGKAMRAACMKRKTAIRWRISTGAAEGSCQINPADLLFSARQIGPAEYRDLVHEEKALHERKSLKS